MNQRISEDFTVSLINLINDSSDDDAKDEYEAIPSAHVHLPEVSQRMQQLENFT